MSFKSYAQQGSFKPVKVPDESQKILQDGQRQIKGMRAVQKQDMQNQTAIRNTTSQSQALEQTSRQNIFNAEQKSIQLQRDAYMQNFKVEQENAAARTAEGAANMKALVDLSSTAFKGVQAFTEKMEQGKQDAYNIAVYESGITTDEAVALTKLDTGLSDASLRENTTVLSLLDRGVSLETVKFLQKTGAGGGNRWTKSKALMQNTIANAPFEFEQMKQGSFVVAGKEMTYDQAIDKGDLEAVKNIQRQMQRNYITKNLSGVSPELLGTQAFPELKSYWKRENATVMTRVREGMKEEAAAAVDRAFQTQYESDGLYGAWNLVENSTNRKQARKDFFKWAQESAESGKTNLSFNQLAGQKVTIEGKTRTMQEWFGRTDEFQDMKKAFEAKRELDRYQRTEAFEEQKVQFKEATEDVKNYLMSQPNLTQQQVDDAKFELRQKFGMDPAALDNIVVSDDRLLAQQTREVEAMAKDGSLTLSELSKYDYRIFRDFQDVARLYSDAEKSTNKFKTQTDAIKDLVKSQDFIKVLPDGTANPTVRLKAAELTRKFNKEVATRLQAAGPGADANAIGDQVFREIYDDFNTKYDKTNKDKKDWNRLVKEGYYDVFSGTLSSAEEKERVNSTLNAIDTAVLADANQALRTPGLVVDEAAAQALTSSYGQPGWKPGAPVTYMANKLGITPLQVINSQLEALNEKGGKYELLKPTPSQEAIQKNVRPEVRKILENYNTPERSVRGLGSSGKWMKEVVPNGYGDYVEQASQANGLMPWDLAALAEIESGWNVNAVSPTGAAGIMQIQEQWHPEYTYSSNPQEQINYGAKYYGQLLQQFGDPVAAAGAYNVGPNAMLDHLNNGTPLPQETIDHMKKFAKAQYKYGKRDVLSQARTMRPSQSQFTMSTTAASYIGMDTSMGPDGGNNACVWALNKVMRTSGVSIPWGDSVYVPEVKNILDKKGRRVDGPQPGAIAIMQDNGSPPYPHIGIVGPDGLIISNSSSRGRFDWQGTPAEYEQKYGRPNLYYMI